MKNLRYRTIIDEQSGNPQAYGLEVPFYSISLYDTTDRLVDRIVSGTTQPGPRTRYTTSLSSTYLGTIDAEPLEEIRELFRTLHIQ